MATGSQATEDKSEKIYVRKSSGLVRAVSTRQALLANILSMGIMGPVLYVMYAVGTAPHGNIPLTVFVGLGIVLLIGYVYWMLSSSMPRTGGDYVWTSRILHPFLGFIESSMLLFVMITSFVSYDIYLAVTNGFSYVFINYGYLAHDQGLVNFGVSLIDNQFRIVVISIVLSLLVIGVMFMPTKRIMRVLIGGFFVTILIFLVYIGLLVSTGHSGFIDNFNARSGTTYQTIVDTATSADWSYNAYGTLFIGLVFIMLSYIGLVNSSYFAGEVSGNPFKSQGIAIVGAPLIYAVFLFTVYFTQFSTYGHNFLVSATSMYYAGAENYPTFGLPSGVGSPSGVFLVNFLTNSPALSALVAFGVALQFIIWGMVFYLVPTRYIFSWSFDRILPIRFSNTTKKGVPHYAVALYGILTVVFVILSVYTSILSFYAYAIFGFYLSTTIVLIAGALFPFRRKDIFESSHKYVKMKVGGVPVITIVATLGAIFSAITMIVTVLPSYTGFPIDLMYFMPVVLMLVLATVIYAASYYYNKSKGLPVEMIGKEIPPL
jgi:amino acid transporter